MTRPRSPGSPTSAGHPPSPGSPTGAGRSSSDAKRSPPAESWLAPERRFLLKAHLDALALSYDYPRHVARDPLQFVIRYPDAADAEVAAFVASALAYGIVGRVLHDVENALARMGPSPALFVRGFDPHGHPEKAVFQGFLHRMTGEDEMRALCHALGSALREDGSVEARFARFHSSGAATVREGLEGLVTTMRRDMEQVVLPGIPAEESKRRSRRIRFLLPCPSEGSACKRLNLVLRWMVRRQEGVDLGLWTAARPAQLILPLDAHTVRLSQYLGLTRLTAPNWRMAEEITAALRSLDPEDPVKYDFALCHLGISGDCLRRHDADTCPRCPIGPLCHL